MLTQRSRYGLRAMILLAKEPTIPTDPQLDVLHAILAEMRKVPRA